MKRVLCILTAATLVFSLCSCNKHTDEEQTTTTEETTEFSTQVEIEEPSEIVPTEIEDTTASTTTTTATTKSTTKSQSTTKKNTTVKNTTTKNATTKKVTTKKTTTKRVTTKKAVQTTKATTYSCGSKNHHCSSAEDHIFVCSLEEKGCPICGSHSCKSFYALDEWGQQCYDITKCPQYSEKKDPTIYCEYCGKKMGDGSNGTCVRFLCECDCPDCGKHVKANTCHSH